MLQSDNPLKDSIAELKAVLGDGYKIRETIFLLESQINSLIEDKIGGVIDPNDARLRESIIKKKLFAFIDGLKKEDTAEFQKEMNDNLQRANDLYLAKKYGAAVQIYAQYANLITDSEIQYRLGWMHEKGHSVEKDIRIAADWYLAAADQNHALSCVRLGRIFEKGLGGIWQDEKLAMKYYEDAAELDHPYGQVRLGSIFMKRGEEEDAVYWFRKAANQNDPYGQVKLGDVYRDGIGVQVDYEEAVYWYQKAIDQGYARAEVRIGAMFESGLGFYQDLEKALKWYKRAAEKGNSAAQEQVDRIEGMNSVEKNVQLIKEKWNKSKLFQVLRKL